MLHLLDMSRILDPVQIDAGYGIVISRNTMNISHLTITISHLTAHSNTKANIYKMTESCLLIIYVVSVFNSDAFS